MLSVIKLSVVAPSRPWWRPETIYQDSLYRVQTWTLTCWGSLYRVLKTGCQLFWGLYYKNLRIRNLWKKGKFCSKLMCLLLPVEDTLAWTKNYLNRICRLWIRNVLIVEAARGAMTFGKMTLSVKVNKHETEHNIVMLWWWVSFVLIVNYAECCKQAYYADCRYVECRGAPRAYICRNQFWSTLSLRVCESQWKWQTTSLLCYVNHLGSKKFQQTAPWRLYYNNFYGCN